MVKCPSKPKNIHQGVFDFKLLELSRIFKVSQVAKELKTSWIQPEVKWKTPRRKIVEQRIE